METPKITVGKPATWLNHQRFRRAGRAFRSHVTVLDIRKKTARVRAFRYDGTCQERFVKLASLWPGRGWR